MSKKRFDISDPTWIRIAYLFALAFMCYIHTHYGGTPFDLVSYMIYAPGILFLAGCEYAVSAKEKKFSVPVILRDAFIKLLIPYAAVSFFSYFLQVINDGIKLPIKDALKAWGESMFWSLGFSDGTYAAIGVLFILPALFLVSIVGPLLRKLTGKYIGLIISVAIAAGGYFLASREKTLPLSLGTAMIGIFFYMAGIFFIEHKDFFIKFKFVILGAAAVVLGISIYKSWFMIMEYRSAETPVSMLAALSGVIMIVFVSGLIATFLPKAGKFLGLFGTFHITFICIHNLDGYLSWWWFYEENLVLTGIIRFLMLALFSLFMGMSFERLYKRPEELSEITMNFSGISEKRHKIFDTLFFICYALVYAKFFFHSTLFPMIVRDFTVIDRIYNIAAFLLAFFALGKIATLKNKWYALLAFGIVLVGFLHWSRGGSYAIFLLCMSIVAMIGRDFRPVLVISLVIGSTMMIAAYWASMHGYIPYLVYDTGGEYGSHAFGMVYRTDFASHVLYLSMAYAALRKEKITSIGYMGIVFATWFVWRYTHARMNSLCLVIFLAGYGIFILLSLFGKKINIPKWFFIAHPLALMAALAAVFLYKDRTGNVFGMDAGSFWGRLQLSQQGFAQYGVKLFGQVVSERGAGGIPDESKPYFFLDISYVRTLVIYGILMMIVYLAVMMIASYRASKKKNYVLSLALLTIALVSLIEHHATELHYDVFILAAFANIDPKKEGENKWITKFKQSVFRKKKNT